MMHTSELRWNDVQPLASDFAGSIMEQMSRAEAAYEQGQEALTFCFGSVASLAELLFHGTHVDPGAEPPATTSATPMEIQMTQDLLDCLNAIKELCDCLNNIDVPAADRAALLRRMA